MPLTHYVHSTRKLFLTAIFLIAAVACVPVVHAEEEGFQYFTAKIQGTWVWQKHPSFNAPYSGDSSLSPDTEVGHTLTGTAYLGARPWKGTEFL